MTVRCRGERGELIFRGPNLPLGYVNGPEATAEALRGGWYHSGDVGYMDAEGYVYIVDRIKDTIICGGYNIYPKEVEDVIYAHAAVLDVAVVGVADEAKGEIPKACVVLKPAASVTAGAGGVLPPNSRYRSRRDEVMDAFPRRRPADERFLLRQREDGSTSPTIRTP